SVSRDFNGLRTFLYRLSLLATSTVLLFNTNSLGLPQQSCFSMPIVWACHLSSLACHVNSLAYHVNSLACHIKRIFLTTSKAVFLTTATAVLLTTSTV
ncbi:unnamed protein product, partial [Ectocarpus sp. 13 AM-2016]